MSAHKRSVLVGAVFFLLFALLFFVFTFFFARASGGGSWKGWASGAKIAVVRVEGVILDSAAVTDALRRYMADDGIRAILMRIDSPGGGVVPSQEIYDEVKKIRTEGKKKIVTSMGSVAASGGYYIASASDRIIANPGTVTGSLGVVMELANLEGLIQKVGVERVVIKSGKNKDIGSPFRKMSDEERNLLQGVLDDMHGQFIQAVSEGRSMDIEKVRALADGRIFTGRHAKELGLVDELGGFDYAVKRTASLAGIDGEPELVEPHREPWVWDFLKGVSSWGFGRGYAPASTIQMNYLFTF